MKTQQGGQFVHLSSCPELENGEQKETQKCYTLEFSQHGGQQQDRKQPQGGDGKL